MDNATVAKIFLRFQVLYGHRWISVVPDDRTREIALAEWQHQLDGLSVSEIECGFNRLAQRYADWPPTVFEFCRLCRPLREPYERPEFQGRALPQKPLPRDEQRQRLRLLKADLGII